MSTSTVITNPKPLPLQEQNGVHACRLNGVLCTQFMNMFVKSHAPAFGFVSIFSANNGAFPKDVAGTPSYFLTEPGDFEHKAVKEWCPTHALKSFISRVSNVQQVKTPETRHLVIINAQLDSLTYCNPNKAYVQMMRPFAKHAFLVDLAHNAEKTNTCVILLSSAKEIVSHLPVLNYIRTVFTYDAAKMPNMTLGFGIKNLKTGVITDYHDESKSVAQPKKEETVATPIAAPSATLSTKDEEEEKEAKERSEQLAIRTKETVNFINANAKLVESLVEEKRRVQFRLDVEDVIATAVAELNRPHNEPDQSNSTYETFAVEVTNSLIKAHIGDKYPWVNEILNISEMFCLPTKAASTSSSSSFSKDATITDALLKVSSLQQLPTAPAPPTRVVKRRHVCAKDLLDMDNAKIDKLTEEYLELCLDAIRNDLNDEKTDGDYGVAIPVPLEDVAPGSVRRHAVAAANTAVKLKELGFCEVNVGGVNYATSSRIIYFAVPYHGL